MIRRRIFILVCLITVLVIGCKTSETPTKSKKDPVIVNLGEREVYVSEFKYVYEKSVNNKDSLYERQSVQDYLDLFINFKLKVTEAQNLGVDTSRAFNQELATYEQVLAKPYLADQSALDQLLQEAYTRLKQDVKVQHILLNVPQDAPPQDTLVAYKKMQEIRKQALSGEDFTTLVQNHSQDPSAASNQGIIGYFSALQMVYPFENAAYNVPIGEISDIVRTRFGYHLIRVMDRRPSMGTIQVAHIMVQVPQNADDETLQQARGRIDAVYTELENGADWDQTCAEYSDDASSMSKGGVLPEFKVGQVIPIFEETVANLDRPQQYSEPVRSPYGWHVIKLISRKPVASFAELRDNLKQDISKDSRYDKSQDILLNRLKTEYKFQENTSVLTEALGKSDARLLEADWSYNSTDALVNKTLFTLQYNNNNTNYMVKDFFDYIYLKQFKRPDAKEAQHAMLLYYPSFVKESLLDFERNNLVDKYAEYKSLVNEYREGMMLFQMMTDKVWQKAIQDTVGLKRFFAQNRNRYQWGQRAQAVIYEVRNQDILGQLKSLLLENTYPVSDIQIENLYFEKDDNSLSENSVASLRKLISALQADPSLSVEITGHADPSEQNSLAQDRVTPVVRYLTFKGVKINRIVTKEFGYTKPVSRTDRSKNRRVEFRIFSSNKKTLENILNIDNPNNLKVVQGDFQRGDNAQLDQLSWAPGTYTQEQNGKIYYIEIEAIKEPRAKEYDEARGFVITDYQKYLEQAWLEELKKKYPIEIQESVIEDIIQQ